MEDFLSFIEGFPKTNNCRSRNATFWRRVFMDFEIQFRKENWEFSYFFCLMKYSTEFDENPMKCW